ncbi:MAG: undecaprenyl/decaprenyl-phosphate alpha-N-acetylglucosaminyl 1-phosphate transferase, partial [Acidobacteriota bacterium]|nr:undecaprenyl/decaprenyl-phosphate alpha-N-acetylglucosaminyl 1-phosphate transferase [Acidobacteriota bacterium]
MRYLDAVFAFLVATAVAALLTPLAGRLARRVGAIAYPSDRGLAREPTPELGGLAILAAVVLAAVIWLPGTIVLSKPLHAGAGPGGVVHTWILIGGAVLIALVGAIDDAIDLSPLLKLAGQVGAGVVAAAGGAVINNVTLPFIGGLQFTDASRPLSVVWLVALMNIVNFSDGVDGLAAGVCTIDGIAFAVIAFSVQGGTSAAAVLAAITAGASLGFLFHNRYPAKIFMGDTGANLLGYLLGVAAVIGSLKSTATVALAVPLLVLAVPFMDTGFVVAKRLKYKQAPWRADAEHFHHRMARIGFSQRKTVAYLYAWTVMLAGVALALKFVPYKDHDTPGHYHLGWAIVMGVILLVALVASVYLVYVLEIFKFKSLRTIQLRRVDPDTSEHEIVASVEREIETGEFDAVTPARP